MAIRSQHAHATFLCAFLWLLLTTLPAAAAPSRPPPFRLLTLDPGHFHASLVQKFMYAYVDPVVHVYAPVSDDVEEHLKRVESFNRRSDHPTHWREVVYRGPDFLEKMLAEKAGNVVVIAGNNTRKTDYIVRSVDAGLHVLGDKPMAINSAEFARLQQAFTAAANKHVLLYDIMTERFEITTILQRELSHQPALFGSLAASTPENPAVVMESVHYFSKTVAGAPLKRPTWFFDVRQEGESIVDVGVHLVDLVEWELFPDQLLSPKDVDVLSARHWPLPITREQFKRVTGAEDFPAFLQPALKDGILQEYANGELTYRLRGVYARVRADWGWEAKAGGDSHHSILRGTKATLEIRQTADENFKPVLYIERPTDDASLPDEKAVGSAIAALQAKYPGIAYARAGERWKIAIPEKYDVGHEAHFSQVTENFLRYLRAGKVPDWEIAAMLTKYATTTRALELAQQAK